MSDDRSTILFATIAFVLLALATIALLNSKACAAELWREGPVTIEAQVGTLAPLEFRDYNIVRVDKYGQIFRYGRNYMELNEDALRGIIRDLIDFEIEKSRPQR